MVVTDAEPDRLAPLPPPAPVGLRGVWVVAARCCAERARLRKNEEHLKSALRDREAEIAALRNSVLAGSTSRQALLDKRRFEAVEKVWTAVNDIAPLKDISFAMATYNYKHLVETAEDPSTQQFLSIIGVGVDDKKHQKCCP